MVVEEDALKKGLERIRKEMEQNSQALRKAMRTEEAYRLDGAQDYTVAFRLMLN